MNAILTAIALLIAGTVVGSRPGATVAASAPQDTTIILSITASGRNTITQPEALDSLLAGRVSALAPHESSSTRETTVGTPTSGFRIQVFLDNNPRTAKATARSRAAAIAARFPELRTYITYNSPYWRLRCGDFTTHAQAAQAAQAIRDAFPASAKEVRVVRDRINP